MCAVVLVSVFFFLTRGLYYNTRFVLSSVYATLAVVLFSPQIVREALQNEVKIMCKSSSVDLVTKTDQKVEQLIITSVKEKFPTHRCSLT